MCHECVAKKKSANMSYEDALNKIEHLLSSEASAAGLVASFGDGPDADGSLSGSGGDPGATVSGQSEVPPGPEGELSGVGVRDSGAGGDIVSSRRTINRGEANTQVNNLRNQSVGEVENLDSQTRPSKRKICQNYLKKNCRYGKSGRVGGMCNFEHPKLCYKFIKFGKTRKGCEKGTSCDYHHPRMCWEFAKKAECKRINCRYYHARWGSQKIGAPHDAAIASETQRTTQENRGKQHPASSIEPVVRAQTMPMNYSGAVTGKVSDLGVSREGVDPTANFLMLQSQLQAHFHQMQQFMEMMLHRNDAKVGNPRQVSCRCGPPSL